MGLDIDQRMGSPIRNLLLQKFCSEGRGVVATFHDFFPGDSKLHFTRAVPHAAMVELVMLFIPLFSIN
jgi:hypothetical protein